MRNLTAILLVIGLAVPAAAMADTSQAAAYEVAQNSPLPGDLRSPDYPERAPVSRPSDTGADHRAGRKLPAEAEANSTDQTVLVVFGLMALVGLAALTTAWIQGRRGKMRHRGQGAHSSIGVYNDPARPPTSE